MVLGLSPEEGVHVPDTQGQKRDTILSRRNFMKIEAKWNLKEQGTSCLTKACCVFGYIVAVPLWSNLNKEKASSAYRMLENRRPPLHGPEYVSQNPTLLSAWVYPSVQFVGYLVLTLQNIL